jgi:hypothetical protein
MPFTDPIKPGDTLETVRRIARIAQMLLDMRNEYERRPTQTLLTHMQERAKELYDMSQTLDKPDGEEPPTS